MKAVILYHPNQEFGGLAEDFKRDFESRMKGREIELVSLETVAGADMAKLYDVVRYPAILVISDSGGLQKLWQDRPLPMIDEVAAYLRA